MTNGFFGVETRGETVGPNDSRVRQRLIINMVPSNKIQHAIPGDLEALSTKAQWNSLQLEHLEVMLSAAAIASVSFTCSAWSRAGAAV